MLILTFLCFAFVLPTSLQHPKAEKETYGLSKLIDGDEISFEEDMTFQKDIQETNQKGTQIIGPIKTKREASDESMRRSMLGLAYAVLTGLKSDANSDTTEGGIIKWMKWGLHVLKIIYEYLGGPCPSIPFLTGSSNAEEKKD